MNKYEAYIDELLKQKLEFEQSIKYASYIQKALLPSQSDINFCFPDNFVLFLPRDVVSGDFYWINSEDNIATIAVGDSTGHGVPGAFLSILGISFLNLVISKHSPDTPSTLLNYLREYVMKALNQTGSAKEQKDGIDLSVCMVNHKTGLLSYSGAFNPLYIVRDSELTQLTGDKMPVGVAAEFENSFTSQNFQLQKGDSIYLFTDGYPDQFGGAKGKKLKYPTFRKLLIQASGMTINKQEAFLKKELSNWMGDQEQLDDVTILGFSY